MRAPGFLGAVRGAALQTADGHVSVPFFFFFLSSSPSAPFHRTALSYSPPSPFPTEGAGGRAKGRGGAAAGAGRGGATPLGRPMPRPPFPPPFPGTPAGAGCPPAQAACETLLSA